MCVCEREREREKVIISLSKGQGNAIEKFNNKCFKEQNGKQRSPLT